MAFVLIITGGHLCHNPRVLKEASALANAGYHVEVLGGWLDPVLKARDQNLLNNVNFRFRPVHDLTQKPALRFAIRLRCRIARLIHQKTAHESPWQLGYFVSALRRQVSTSKADLLLAHSEQALWAISPLQPSTVRTGLDMEDWFSEDLPIQTRRQRPLRLLRLMANFVQVLRANGQTFRIPPRSYPTFMLTNGDLLYVPKRILP